jgi:phosphatidylserine/phosphatidylglycerophosphate/cardiolipin synthase-like enzyme
MRTLGGVFIMLIGLAIASPILAFQPPAAPAKILPATGTVQVAFSPHQDAAALVLETIAGARREILVQAFSFTHRKIAEALIAARRRGVEVQLIADPDQIAKIPTTVVPRIAAGGVPVLLDFEHESTHDKVIIVDAGSADCAVVTGSYNFTHAAQFKNAENLIALRGNAPLCEAYRDNWRHHAAHAQRYRAQSNSRTLGR